GLARASARAAEVVILEIDTFGGELDASIQIRDALLDSPQRTIAFVNKRAISAARAEARASPWRTRSAARELTSPRTTIQYAFAGVASASAGAREAKSCQPNRQTPTKRISHTEPRPEKTGANRFFMVPYRVST
ncbi:hypothetical protein MYX77_13255, partial [Acidobacteriia bacterium AH_259_A11_L15]|nr:hypothetical protein [Acidobacteriia bacterium AH_259_A11_L15]